MLGIKKFQVGSFATIGDEIIDQVFLLVLAQETVTSCFVEIMCATSDLK